MTTKERLYRMIDALPETEARMVERMLNGLHVPEATTPTVDEGNEGFHAHMHAAGLHVTLAGPSDPSRWERPLLDLSGVDLSGAVLEERDEALQRWD